MRIKYSFTNAITKIYVLCYMFLKNKKTFTFKYYITVDIVIYYNVPINLSGTIETRIIRIVH